MAIWIGTIVVIVVIWLIAAIRVTPQFATGLAVLSLMLVPAWCQIEIFRLPFFAYHAATLICLCMYCVHPKSTFPVKLGIVDFFGLGFIATNLISDTLVEGWHWLFLVRAYFEWACPYIAGRLAFQKWSDVKRLVPYGLTVATILGLDSALESMTGLHPFEWIHGLRPFENVDRIPIRWGLIRSWGTRAHPIYFGNIQLMLLAWPAFAAYKSLKGEWSIKWLVPFVLCCFGIFFTVSRAPMLGVVVALAIAVFILRPRLRIPVAATTAALLIGTVLFWPMLREIVIKSEKSKGGRLQETLIQMEGEQVEYSGSMSRWYEFKLYFPAAVRGGLFGYGTDATAEFPPRVGVHVEDVRALRRWKFVDNSYLLLTLRFGFLGLICFSGMGIASFLRMAFRALDSSADVSVMAALQAGCLGAILVVVGTVWLAPDFQFLLYWMFGIGSAPAIMRTNHKEDT